MRVQCDKIESLFLLGVIKSLKRTMHNIEGIVLHIVMAMLIGMGHWMAVDLSNIYQRKGIGSH